MNKLSLQNYNLHKTLLGGQAFTWDWDQHEHTFWGTMQDKLIQIKIPDSEQNKPIPKFIYWQTYPKKDDGEFVNNYLRLNDNYSQIIKSISKDEYVSQSIDYNPGLRLLNQDFEQTLLSYTLASVKSISSIRQSIKLLSKKLGEKIRVKGKTYHLFPKAEVIAKASDSDLKQTKIGFRSKYLKSAASFLLENSLIEENNLTQQQVIERLKSIHGVGDKIADCVMCYSLGYDNITPVDVWGKRYLVEYYGLDPKSSYKEMRSWIEDYFGEYGAWAGQFLFEYIRENYK